MYGQNTSVAPPSGERVPIKPVIGGRGRGRGRGHGGSVRKPVPNRAQSSYIPSSKPARPSVPKAVNTGELILPKPSSPVPRRRGGPPTRGTPQRPLPGFNSASGGIGVPSAPPRSPVVSPRRENLPPLPHRPPLSGDGAAEPGISEEKAERRAEMRRKCLDEIYQTEKGYIEDLEIIINVFIFPFRTMQILDDKMLYNIFSNVEVLINCNMEMLNQLEKTMNTTVSGNEAEIGKVFTQLADYFKMYKVFCANQQTSLATVEQLIKKNTQFKKKLDVCHTDDRCKGLFLQSFLIKPIQRVCKYPLLLRELIKFTPESHTDWEPLQSAFSKINGVVTDINEAQRQAEGLQRILDLQKMIDGVDSLVYPGRNYVKEGVLTFYKSAKSKNGEKRHIFFFTDLILMTIKKGDKNFQHKLSVELGTCRLTVFADSAHIKNAFELEITTDGKAKACILSGETSAEANQWVKEIRGLIKNYQKKKLAEMNEQSQRITII